MDELHQQTVNLLSFQPLPKDVYDAQVAFNMLARHGQKSQPRSIPSRRGFPPLSEDWPETMLRSPAPVAAGSHLSRLRAWPFFWKWRTPSMSRPCRKPWPAIMSRFLARTTIFPAT